MKWLYPCLFCFFVIFADELKVDLVDPTFKNGVLYTSQGGVIKNSDIRIQARNIQYFHRMENGKIVQRIEADGDLLIQYKGRVFVGSEFEFDFTKMCGTVFEGKTFSTMWYVGGDKIALNSDGSYKVTNAFITTCENKDSTWDLHALKVNVVKNEYLKAKNVRLRFLRFPSLWLPSFKINLKNFKAPVFRYYLNWNKGPKLGFRYQVYSWGDFSLYGRVEYRYAKGFGGAIETEYFPENKRTTFVTRSYLGTDRLFNEELVDQRYRVQGLYDSKSKSGKTHTIVSWDKYSDVKMPGDFVSEDFQVNTALKTQFYIHHKEKDIITTFKFRPRVNPFESLEQDLPSIYIHPRPIVIKNTGILSTNFIKASYLNFKYSSQLTSSLPDFHTPRVEFFERLDRPFPIGKCTVTPYLGARAIFYGTTQTHNSKCLGLLDYGVKANAMGKKEFSHYKHLVEPYFEYKALTRPTVSPNDHYIFSLQDGYEKIQQIEIGIKNLLFSKKRVNKEASFTADLYANAFFQDPVIPQIMPRMYLYLTWNLPSVYLTWNNCYNFRHHLLDFVNARLKWTVNQDIAMCLEARYRSKYDWRKGDKSSFILDVSRSEKELLESPLSNQRIGLLSNIFIRINPFWEVKFESHHGLYQLYKNSIRQKPFNEFRIHLYTWISSSWKLHMYYGYTLNNHFDYTINVQMVKKEF